MFKMSSSDRLLLDLYCRRYDEECHRLEVLSRRNQYFLVLYCVMIGFSVLYSHGILGLLGCICLCVAIFFGVCGCMPQPVYSTPSVSMLDGRAEEEYYGKKWYDFLFSAFGETINSLMDVQRVIVGYFLWGTRFFLLGVFLLLLSVVVNYVLPGVWL